MNGRDIMPELRPDHEPSGPLAAGIFLPDVYAGPVIVIAYTTLLAPFWIKLFYKLHGDALVNQENQQ